MRGLIIHLEMRISKFCDKKVRYGIFSYFEAVISIYAFCTGSLCNALSFCDNTIAFINNC